MSLSHWLCFGDLNEILHLDEKNGGNDKEVSMIGDFREVVQDCNLRDLSYLDHFFTWSNRRFGYHLVEERLDRFLCSKDLTNCFQDQAAINMVTWCSNHNLVFMETIDGDDRRQYDRRT